MKWLAVLSGEVQGSDGPTFPKLLSPRIWAAGAQPGCLYQSYLVLLVGEKYWQMGERNLEGPDAGTRALVNVILLIGEPYLILIASLVTDCCQTCDFVHWL